MKNKKLRSCVKEMRRYQWLFILFVFLSLKAFLNCFLKSKWLSLSLYICVFFLTLLPLLLKHCFTGRDIFFFSLLWCGFKDTHAVQLFFFFLSSVALPRLLSVNVGMTFIIHNHYIKQKEIPTNWSELKLSCFENQIMLLIVCLTNWLKSKIKNLG